MQGNDKILVFASIVKLIDSKISLDSSSVYAKKSSLKKNNKLAKDKYKQKQFWLKYGDENELSDFDKEQAAAAKIVEQSIAQFSGGAIRRRSRP